MLALFLCAIFLDDFEKALDRWQVVGAPWIRIEDSKDASHGHVLVLDTAGDVYALIKDSEKWGGVSIEGDVLFPTDEDNYLGVIYNFRRRPERTDFGVVYIKGNGSYLQANPHRDFNVSRLVYPELHPMLTGKAAIEIGKWQHFKVEVSGRMCHFYVGDMETPQMTFPFFEFDSGAVGLQPRCCGGPVWVDNIRVASIDKLSYDGPPKPDVKYSPQSMITSWQVIGPLAGTKDEVGRAPGKFTWQPFATDERGAVITARVVEYHGPRPVAYFRTQVKSDVVRNATLHLSTADDYAMWVNGRFRTFGGKNEAAWYDFRQARKVTIPLVAGTNEIVIRVRAGVSATGGFFARIE